MLSAVPVPMELELGLACGPKAIFSISETSMVPLVTMFRFYTIEGANGVQNSGCSGNPALQGGGKHFPRGC